MNHEVPRYDDHPERTQNEWQTLMTNGVVDTDFKPTKEYLESEQGQREIEAQNKAYDQTKMVDRLIANAEEQVENGRYSNAEFERLKQKYEAKKEAYQAEADRQREAAMQDFSDSFIDRNSVGTEEEQRRYEEFLRKHDAENIANLKARGVLESEKISADENEKTLADEREKEAALEAEKTGTHLEDVEDLNSAEAEARIAEHQRPQQEALADKKTGTYLEDAENPTPNEAEARIAEHQRPQQEALATTEQAEAPDPRRLEALENHLGELRVELAELFVKKNRIFGPKHRAEYNEARDKYESALENYLRLKSKTDEELFQNYLEEDNKLLEDVDNQVDNGNFFRKIISRTLGNEYYKQAMHAHGARSLGVAGAESVRPIPNSRQPEATPASSQPEATSTSTVEPTSAELSPAPVPESTPESTPEPTSESQPTQEQTPESAPEPESSPVTDDTAENTAENTNENPPETSEPESSSEESSTEETKDSRLDKIKKYFRKTPLDDEGYNIIDLDRATVNDVAGQREIDNRIAVWWEGLDGKQKDRVRQYENGNLRSRYGGALRYWLQQHNKL